MPLINCPDCETEISDRAASCVKCGYPIQEFVASISVDQDHRTVAQKIQNDKPYKIGRQVVNWGGNAFLKNLTADIEAGVLGPLEPGKFSFFLHRNGIRIRNKLSGAAYFDIHFRQIIDISETSAEELVHENKSVIGRGVVGGVLLGPAGAIVGALSAMKPASLKKLTIIKLSFCRDGDLSRQDVYFQTPRGTSAMFVAKAQKEISIARTR